MGQHQEATDQDADSQNSDTQSLSHISDIDTTTTTTNHKSGVLDTCAKLAGLEDDNNNNIHVELDQNNNQVIQSQDDNDVNYKNVLLKSDIELKPEPEAGSNLASALMDSFRRHSDRCLLVDGRSGRHWKGADLAQELGRIGCVLRRQVGLIPGQVVMTICEHGEREILVALGSILAGGSLFGTSSQDGYEEEKVLCEIVAPDLIATESKYHHMAAMLRNQVDGLAEKTKILWVDNPAAADGPEAEEWRQIATREKVFILEDLMKEQPEVDWSLLKQIAQQELRPDEDVLTFMLTSGSTGRPKVVPSTHTELMWGLYGMRAASGAEDTMLPVYKDSVLAGDLPLDHGAGINLMFLSLLEGAKFVLLPSFDEEAFWEGVHRFKITTSIGSTTFGYKLLTYLKAHLLGGSESETPKWNISSLRHLYCVGAKVCFHDLIADINKELPDIRFGQAYGCTEVGFIAILRPSECRDHLDSVGHLFPGIEAKLVHPETGELIELTGLDGGQELSEAGELLVRARSKFKGYRCWRDDDSHTMTQQCHDNMGFYRTGDQASFDSEGRLYIRGRFKDTLVLMGDWKILPAELEALIDTHPLVEFSAVVGVPHPKVAACHQPRAFVKLYDLDAPEVVSLSEKDELRMRLEKDDRQFIVDDIFRFVAERTAAPKHLHGGVRILEAFPQVGLLKKVDRNALKAMG